MRTGLRRLLYMLIIMCIMTGIIPVNAYADEELYVYDLSGILSTDELVNLNNKAADISEKYNSGTYIVIVPDYYDYAGTVEDAAVNIYQSMNFGYGDDNNGEVLLLSMSDRDYSLTVKGYAANEAFNEYARSIVEEAFLDDLHDDEWYSGLDHYLDKSRELLELAANGTPLTRESSPLFNMLKWGISLIIGLVLAIIIGLGIKSTMKSVAAKVEARNYVKDGSLDISYRNDYFKYSTETRHKIEKSSSSSSNSGGFSSSSGKF